MRHTQPFTALTTERASDRSSSKQASLMGHAQAESVVQGRLLRLSDVRTRSARYQIDLSEIGFQREEFLGLRHAAQSIAANRHETPPHFSAEHIGKAGR
jgi:hypothetical protein